MASTPANLRDKHQRIFAWFDEHGDIARDSAGELQFDEHGRIRRRQNQPPLTFEDFARFGPAASSPSSRTQTGP